LRATKERIGLRVVGAEFSRRSSDEQRPRELILGDAQALHRLLARAAQGLAHQVRDLAQRVVLDRFAGRHVDQRQDLERLLSALALTSFDDITLSILALVVGFPLFLAVPRAALHRSAPSDRTGGRS